MAVSPASQAYVPEANVPGGYTTLPIALTGKIQSYLPASELNRQVLVHRQTAKALVYTLAHRSDSKLLDLYLEKVAKNNGFERAIPSPVADEFSVSTARVFSAVCDKTLGDDGIEKLRGSLKTIRLLRLHFSSHVKACVYEQLFALDWKQAKELKWIFLSGAIDSKNLQRVTSNFGCPSRMLADLEPQGSPILTPKSPPLAALFTNNTPQVPTDRSSPTKVASSPPRPLPKSTVAKSLFN